MNSCNSNSRKPKISVCIPAYNRKEVLPELLDSVFSQEYADYEVIICEDGSPQRADIRAICSKYSVKFPGRVAYFENERNLGYDGNIRRLIERSAGDYCFFMGNDDLMAPGALATVGDALKRNPSIGVILRTYAAFDNTPDNISQVFRYFPEETLFPAGHLTSSTFYRRCVVIPGLVINREAALMYSTDRFDGTLLYQLYLVGNILLDMPGLSLPQVLAYYRNGGTPDFGNSEKERGTYTPKQQTAESSVAFMRGMLDIASYIDSSRNADVYKGILNDIGNYSYPILAIQAKRPFREFVRYVIAIGKLGLWKNKYFYLYVLAIAVLGTSGTDRAIRVIKRTLGYTPKLGQVYNGVRS